MFSILNKSTRRVFAWPLVLVGVGFVQLGGWMICAGAWAMDFDVSQLLSQARGEK